MGKWTCRECDWKGTEEQMLTADNPFNPMWKICGCPGCRLVDPFDEACDMPDCWQHTCCGTPTPDGYKRLCSKHYHEYDQSRKAADPRANGPDHEEDPCTP